MLKNVGVLLVAFLCTTHAIADKTIGGSRPTTLHVPESYDPRIPVPLLLMLHGCPGNGAGMESLLRFVPLADEIGFLYAAPDGLPWLSDHAWTCGGRTEENSAYLRGLLDEAQALFRVDRDC
jgi:polyhydroxybutyrate depolymerase